jgi:hypothetical protein
MATSAVWKCERKIEVSLGVVSFLWFVSLDKQRNEQEKVIAVLKRQ